METIIKNFTITKKNFHIGMMKNYDLERKLYKCLHGKSPYKINLLIHHFYQA